MTDFTFRALNSSSSASSASVVITKPTGTVEGDILFAMLSRYPSGSPSSSPSGWALVDGTSARSVNALGYTAIWYKIAGGSEPSDYTWTWSSANKVLGSMYGFYGDHNTSDSIHVESDVVYDVVNTTIRAQGMTTSKDNLPVLWFGSIYYPSADTITKPAGFTNECTQQGGTTSDLYHKVAYDIFSTGSTGNQDGTLVNSNNAKHAYMVALELATSNRAKAMSHCHF